MPRFVVRYRSTQRKGLMKLSDFPISFQKWIEKQSPMPFDTVPLSLRLVIVKRYRDETMYEIKQLMEDRDKSLSVALPFAGSETKYLVS